MKASRRGAKAPPAMKIDPRAALLDIANADDGDAVRQSRREKPIGVWCIRPPISDEGSGHFGPGDQSTAASIYGVRSICEDCAIDHDTAQDKRSQSFLSRLHYGLGVTREDGRQ
jgi:hypothetical protein